MGKALVVAFWFMAIAGVVAAQSGSSTYVYLKCIPILILIVDAAIGVLAGDRSRLRVLILVGLIFSVIADWVIMGSFIGGLIFFLLAHLMYVAAMGIGPGSNAARVRAFAPAAVYLVVMLVLLMPRVPGDLTIPVVIYSTIITTMFGLASIRAFVGPADQPARLLWFGALLFVISDTCIALNRWVVTDMHYDSLIIMATYYSGQFFISRGASRVDRKVDALLRN